MCGVLVICAIIGALLISTLVDNYKKIGLAHSKEEKKSPLKLIFNTFKNMKNTNQVLLIPLTVWLGFEQGYLLADFTKVTFYFEFNLKLINQFFLLSLLSVVF